MDVNPKFNQGPTGVEYTSNLTAFEMLGVELMHGWLLDPQDKETAHVIGNKTYNELIELVVQGNDTDAVLEALSKDIRILDERLRQGEQDDAQEEDMVKIPKGLIPISQKDEPEVEGKQEGKDAPVANPSIGETEKEAPSNVSSVPAIEVQLNADPDAQTATASEAVTVEETEATVVSETPDASAGSNSVDAAADGSPKESSESAETKADDVNDGSTVPAAENDATVTTAKGGSTTLSETDGSHDAKKPPAVESEAQPATATAVHGPPGETKLETEKATEPDLKPAPADGEFVLVGRVRCEQHLSDLRNQVEAISEKATTGAVVNHFLQASSHQLTQYGLGEMYNHLAEGNLAVFFRNNHFATITKHGGVLYLLVTDLGYANVRDIMWEKLDVINGDTEYANEFFARPPPQTNMLPAGAVLSPEQLIAQQGQSEVDFQLALQLSKEGTNQGAASAAAVGGTTSESDQIAAATEASLREFNGSDSTRVAQMGGGTVAALPPADQPSSNAPTGPTTSATTAATSTPTATEAATTAASGETAQMSSDLLMAMQMQAEERPTPSADSISVALAQQMQAEENIRARHAREEAKRKKKEAAANQQCVIS